MLVTAFVPSLFVGRPHRPGRAAPPAPAEREHFFGTDEYGRDQFARTVHGTPLSLQAALVAVLIGLVSGSLIGLVAGASGASRHVVMRVVDIMLAVPGLIVSLAIISALGRGTLNVAVAIGLNSTATFARLMRSEVLKVSNAKYVEASVFAGHGFSYRLFRYVVPNASRSVLAAATIEIGTAILGFASLSFLGLGAPPPTPEWGALVATGRSFLRSSGGSACCPASSSSPRCSRSTASAARSTGGGPVSSVDLRVGAPEPGIPVAAGSDILRFEGLSLADRVRGRPQHEVVDDVSFAVPRGAGFWRSWASPARARRRWRAP